MKKISRMLTMALVLGISIFSMSIAAYAGKQQPQAKKLAQEESKPKEYSFKSGNTAVNMGGCRKRYSYCTWKGGKRIGSK